MNNVLIFFCCNWFLDLFLLFKNYLWLRFYSLFEMNDLLGFKESGLAGDLFEIGNILLHL